jgi:hypothetical protein
VLAARYMYFAPSKGFGPVQPSLGWQPPRCMRSSSPAPLSNSWLPTAAICRPIRLSDSTDGSSRNSADSSGDAPIRSPAATTAWFGFSALAAAMAVARCSAPPAGTVMNLPGCAGSGVRMPPSGGIRLPWKSLMAMTFTRTGPAAIGVDAGGGAGAGAVAQPASTAAQAARVNFNRRFEAMGVGIPGFFKVFSSRCRPWPVRCRPARLRCRSAARWRRCGSGWASPCPAPGCGPAGRCRRPRRPRCAPRRRA